MCKDAVTRGFNKAVSKCEKPPMPKMSKTHECFQRVSYTLHLSLLLFSCSVTSNSLWPTLHLQHTRLPCPSPFPRVCSNSSPLSWWCHPNVSSSVVPCSSCLQSFPASRSFPVSWLFTSGGQRIGASASASVLPMNIQGWFPLGLTGLISLQSKRLSRVFSNTIIQKHQFFSAQLSLWFNFHVHTWLWLYGPLSVK